MPWRLALVVVVVVASGSQASAPPAAVDCFGDALPPGAVARFGTVRWRLHGCIQRLVTVPGCNLIATTAATRIDVWDLATGHRVRSLADPYHGLWDVDLPRAGKGRGRFVTVCWPLDRPENLFLKNPQLWLSLRDVTTGQEKARSDKLMGLPVCLRLRPDGKQAAFSFAPAEEFKYVICRWNVSEKRPSRLFRCRPRETPLEIAYSSDGNYLSAILEKRKKYHLRRWDSTDGRLASCVEIGQADVIAMSPDGSTVASFNMPDRLTLTDIASNTNRRYLVAKRKRMPSLSFSDDSKSLMMLDTERKVVELWGVANGKRIRRVKLAGIDEMEADLQLLDNRRFVLALGGVAIMVWDARTGKPLSLQQCPVWRAIRLRFSPDGKYLHSVAGNRQYRWDSRTGRLIAHKALRKINLKPASSTYRHSTDGRYLAEFPESGWWLHDRLVGKSRRFGPKGEDVGARAFSPDGRFLATTGKNRVISIWITSSIALSRRIDASKHMKSLEWLCFSRDGQKLAISDGGRSVSLWYVTTGKHLYTIHTPDWRKPTEPLYGSWTTTFSPDGRYLLAAMSSHLWVWDLVDQREIGPFEKGSRELNSSFDWQADFSADNRYFLCNSAASNPLLYERASGRIVQQLDMKSPFEFTPRGWQFAGATDRDGSVLLWDLPRLMRSLPLPRGTANTDESLWHLMADTDASVAQRALWRLVTRKGVEGFLARKIPPVKAIPDRRLDALLRDLRSDDFETRFQAEQELTHAREAARFALEGALKQADDLEALLRLRRLLRHLEPRSGASLREVRAVLLLEARGTAEAKAVLGKLASGIPQALLTREARAVLTRVKLTGAKK